MNNKNRKQPPSGIRDSVKKRGCLFLLFMNCMFSAKRAILLELNTLRMQLFVLIGRVITATTRHASKLNKLSHKDSPKRNIAVLYEKLKLNASLFLPDWPLLGKEG